MVIPFCCCNLSTSSLTFTLGTTLSLSPFMINPDEGQGAKNEKSYVLAGGDTAMKPVTSGLLIKICIPIHAPKENPTTQHALALGTFHCKKSKAEVASANSPTPWS